MPEKEEGCVCPPVIHSRAAVRGEQRSAVLPHTV